MNAKKPCPVCGKIVATRRDGTVWKHDRTTMIPGRVVKCEGAGKLPR